MKKLSLLFALCMCTVLAVAETKPVAFISEYESIEVIADDDEKAAAEWLVNTYGGTFLPATDITSLESLKDYDAVWVMVDRVGLAHGIANLPSSVTEAMTHVKAFYENGGNVFLSNHATQYTVSIGALPEGMIPSIGGSCWGNGAGGEGSDVWTINAVIGNVTDQIYDHRTHALFTGITGTSEYNGHDAFPLIAYGHREDHNCMWDLNRGEYNLPANPNKVVGFETEYNATILATWGHVVDYCCAGLIEFKAVTEQTGRRGICIANGFAAYEWNQNCVKENADASCVEGTNKFQANIEKLTANTLDYLLKPKNPTGLQTSLVDELSLRAVVADDVLTIENAPANLNSTIYNLSGQQVATFVGATTHINDLISGMYMVRVEMNGRSASMKFIK